eukprot:4946108-Amphidinium_carterae.1
MELPLGWVSRHHLPPRPQGQELLKGPTGVIIVQQATDDDADDADDDDDDDDAKADAPWC